MKLALFFLISVVFHAAIFALPVSFRDYEMGEGGVVPVVFLSGGGGGVEESTGKGKAEMGTEKARPRARKQRHVKIQRPRSESLNIASKPEKVTDTGNQVRPNIQEEAGEKFVIAESKERVGVEVNRGMSLEEVAEESWREKSRGKGNSQIGVGPGGGGEKSDSPGLVFAQANYAHTPKPEYPERARREGWEGTVLLRVLVDQQGRSKRIEVSRSSGFEILDGAAIETVKGWRFHSARYGERRVGSWVKIPIIFRLSDLKN